MIDGHDVLPDIRAVGRRPVGCDPINLNPYRKDPTAMTSRRQAIALFASTGASLWAAQLGAARAQAADWPARPIKLIVPYAPGGSSDTLGRLIARHLGEAFKQTVVVENKAGAGGVIGSQMASKAAADGYTLVVSGIGSHVIAPVDNPGAFDPMKDFTHIAMLAGPPLALVVNAEVPAKDFKSFIAYVGSLPKGLSWGSPGQGTHGHLTGELLRVAAIPLLLLLVYPCLLLLTGHLMQ